MLKTFLISYHFDSVSFHMGEMGEFDQLFKFKFSFERKQCALFITRERYIGQPILSANIGPLQICLIFFKDI